MDALLILYPAGASGEFLASALSQSFDCINESTWHWENFNRCKYFDLFDRALNSGFTNITKQDLDNGVERYINKATDQSLIHIGLCHPNPASLNIISSYLLSVPILEITTHSNKSKYFRYLAATQKIEVKEMAPAGAFYNYSDSKVKCSRHLKIEWSNLLLDDTTNQFKQIEYFIGNVGNLKKFQELVDEYITRNQLILDSLNEQSI